MRTAFFVLLLTTTLATPAFAQDALKVELVPKAQKGQGQPQLVVKARVPLERVVLSVKRSTDGKRFTRKSGPIDGGRQHEFELTMKRVGSARFTGKLEVAVGNGQSGSMPIDVNVELLGQLKLEIAKGDVDLKKRTLKIRSSRPLSKVQVSLMSDTGTPLGTTETEPDEADGKYVVRWKQKKGTVMRIAIQGWDPDGFFSGVDLFPWQVDIPHEEVNFASGKWDIDDAEAEKLEKSYKLITGAIDKYGALAKIRLFIAGHTDTVGDPGSNRTLSNKRARAIGAWFKKRGVKIPIQYAGFGEDVLAVETADETDEVRNRRAEYIVAVDAPPLQGSAARWRPL